MKKIAGKSITITDRTHLSYDTLLNGMGSRLGVSYSDLHYILGDTLESLGGHGTAGVSSLWMKHPLIRTQILNVNCQFQYDHKQLDDHLDASSIKTDRQLNNVTLTVSSDLRDNFIFGGASTLSLAYTSGRVGFDDNAAEQLDASTANTQGSFSKVSISLGRLQGLTSTNSLYINLTGQWSRNNLDTAEKLSAGGPNTVRAYDMGAVSGDSGYLGTIELRHDLKQYWGGQWQAVAFVDSEHLTIDQNPWASGTNDATLSGSGIGINWFGPQQFSSKLYVAHSIGAAPSLVTTGNNSKVWGEINKFF